MVNASKKKFLPLPRCRYGKSTKRYIKRRYQGNEGKSSLQAERVQARGALCSLTTKTKLAAEKQQEMHFLSNEEKVEWIEDYVQRETIGARQ
jgi:hypothetical protein